MESVKESYTQIMNFVLSLNFTAMAYQLISPYKYSSYESVQESSDIENQIEKRSIQFAVVSGNIYVNSMIVLMKSVKYLGCTAYNMILEYYKGPDSETFVNVTLEDKDGKEGKQD